jgi:hypothetical protein
LGAGGKSFVPARVAARVQAGGRLLLSLEGVFECSLITLDLPPGRHTIIAASEHASRPSVKARFTLAGPTRRLVASRCLSRFHCDRPRRLLGG